ncbi:putative polyketide synthase 1 [Glandiceps talaboti]
MTDGTCTVTSSLGDEKGTNKFPIAVIGIGCRMPGGVDSPTKFWDVIYEGRDMVTEIPKERWDINTFHDTDPTKSGKMISRRAGFVDGVDKFDHGFFKISPREAASMDPQQRLLLEVVQESFEDAGIDPDTLKADCGVFVGIGLMDYAVANLDAYHVNPYTLTGIMHNVAANRISYAFDLQGPSYAVDTACASSMTAMHLGCSHLWNKECKVAVISGCNSLLIPEVTIGFSSLGVLSPEGQCCPFSDEAKGYVRSEGWGALILKPLKTALAEGDHIYSVIIGSAIAANGFCGSLTMPLQSAQEYVMHEAYDRFNLPLSSVDYVEAHGTGTPIGDPIEARAIASTFGPHRKMTLKIGSVKGNFSHNECAAGITSTIKVSLMLHNRVLCPSINYKRPNPAIDMKDLKLEVQTKREPFLHGKKYRIGVNSFGIAGAIAHVVIDEAPRIEKKPSHTCGWTFGEQKKGDEILIPLSAKSNDAVSDLARKWLTFECSDDALGVTGWLATRRKHHEHRIAITCRSGDEFRERVQAYLEGKPSDSVITGSVSSTPWKVCFVFPGQGQQYASMGKELYATEKVFRAVVDQCDAKFKKLSGWSLLHDAGLYSYFSPSNRINQFAVNSESLVDEMEVSQPAILFFQIGIFHLLNHWGIHPDVIVGHSLGEVAAAYACGGMSMDEAVTAIYHRSTQQAKLKGAGSMAALRQDLKDAKILCSKYGDLYIAAVNAPGSVTIAGNSEAIKIIQGNKPQQTKQLRIQCAFHTPYMDPIKHDFLEAMNGVVKTSKRQSSTPFFSTVDGKPYGGTFDGNYWWKNIRNPVLFNDAVTNILNDTDADLFIECSASATLLSSVSKIHQRTGLKMKTMTVGLGQRGKDDRHSVLRAMGILYTAGVSVNWGKITHNTAKWAPIPTYPWQHHTHWSEPEDRMKRRLGMEDKSFKGQNGVISINVFPFLADHVVENKIVFPGAGYIEYSFEMFFGENENPALKNVHFQRPLIWPEDTAGRPSKENIPIKASKEGSTIHVTSKEQLYYTAELDTPFSVDESYPCLPILKLQKRCNQPLTNIEIYQGFTAIGLQYGPNFQVLQQMMLGDGEAIAVMSGATDTKQRIQTTLLDGCFQLIIASVGKFTKAYIPVKVGMVQMSLPALPLDDQFIAYAKVTDCDSTSITGDAYLCTNDGKILVKVVGLVVQSLQDISTDVDLKACLYTTEYQPITSCLPPTSDVCQTFEEENLRKLFPKDMDIATRIESIIPLLKRICKSYISYGLSVVDEADIAERSCWYMRRLKKIAHDMTVASLKIEDIPRIIADIIATIPEISQEVQLIKKLGEALPDALREPDIGGSILFAQDYFTTYFAMIRNLFYEAGANALQAAVRKVLKKKKVVRILEVGGRIGGMSKYILGLLKGEVMKKEVEYLFTDLDVSFFTHAQQHLQEFHTVKYKLLDIEKEIEPQGFTPGSVDIIVCANGLHSVVDINNAMHHMKALLCEDGWLFMYEATNMDCISELAFGSQRMYDDFRDDSWWLSRQGCEDLFRCIGYTDVVSVSTPNELLYSIIVGRKSTWSTPQMEAIQQDAQEAWALIGTSGMILQQTIKMCLGEVCKAINELSVGNIAFLGTMESVNVIYICGEWDKDLHFLLELLKFVNNHQENIKSVYVITEGAYRNEGNIWSHSARGLAGSICNYLPSSCIYYVDLDVQESVQQNVHNLMKILTNPTQPERELVVQGPEIILCPRVINAPSPDMSTKASQYWRLEQNARNDGKGKSLDDLGFCAIQDMIVKPGEAKIRVKAAALNFKDVMMAHGMLEGLVVDETRSRFGIECSGVVEELGHGVTNVKVGDEVIAFTELSLASHVVSDARFVRPKPKHLNMVESAGITVAFTTAYHSLIERANLQKDETILIHSACGGVGLAAIQIAKMQGAEIICTAGTEEKRGFLKSEHGIQYVTDSRSERFYNDVMDWTKGKGVDVILNSLYGKLMAKGLTTLAPEGRFCEIGKRDILENSKMDLKTFLENKSFLSCQIDIRLRQNRKGMQKTLEKVVKLFEEKTLNPLPSRTYQIDNYKDAFRMMSKGQHIGKVVFEIPDTYIPERFDQVGDLFQEQATYLVSGAFGGVGQALVRWMQGMGAKHLVMVSRSGVKSAASKRTLDFLKRKGVEIQTFAVDVSDYESIKSVLHQIKSDPAIPALKGVFHLAGVIDETLLPDLKPEQLDLVINSKAVSAQHLHNLTRNDELDIFMMMSSVHALRNLASQPAYCAANSVLEAIAEYRHKLRLPALSLQMGAIRGAGYLEGKADTMKVVKAQGTDTLHINEVMNMMGILLRCCDKPVVCFANQDWATTARFTHKTSLKFRHLQDDRIANKGDCQLSIEDLEYVVKQKLGQMICQAPEEIDISKPMIDFGVDSLMAVELVTWASKELNVVISQLDILGGISTSVLLEKAAENISVLPFTVPHTEA